MVKAVSSISAIAYPEKISGIRNTRLPDQSVQTESVLFSELPWNFSELEMSFFAASCSFHFGVTVEIPINEKSCAVRRNFNVSSG